MRRLGLLTPASLCLLAFACTRDNPAFDDCATDAACVDESGTRGDGDSGDGDPGDGDSGDGDPGDGDPGDGDPGDGDGDEGDGDGDAGDGDGDSGDGDGEPALPTCPEAVWVSMPVVQDTFLDGSPGNGIGCVVDWDFNTNQPVFGNGLCSGLDFGGSAGHWVCSGNGCISAWLGEFELAEWMEFPVQVQEAGFEFTAKYNNFEPNSVVAHELLADSVDFGECGDWHAGEGEGDPPTGCDTTFHYSAFPNIWLANDQLLQGGMIGAVDLPPTGEAYVEQSFFMPIDKLRVQGWLDGETVHHGVLVSSDAWLPTELYLYAKGSGEDPVLKARLCLP